MSVIIIVAAIAGPLWLQTEERIPWLAVNSTSWHRNSFNYTVSYVVKSSNASLWILCTRQGSHFYAFVVVEISLDAELFIWNSPTGTQRTHTRAHVEWRKWFNVLCFSLRSLGVPFCHVVDVGKAKELNFPFNECRTRGGENPIDTTWVAQEAFFLLLASKKLLFELIELKATERNGSITENRSARPF